MLKKYLAASAIVFTLLHPSVASARQWVLIGNNPMISVDIDSIKGEGNTRTFWSEIVNNQESLSSSSYLSRGRDKYTSVKSLNFVDCTQNKIGVLRMVEYDRNGSVIDNYDISHLAVPPNLQSTIPDSVGELQLVYVCGLRTSNEGRSSNTRLSSNTPKPNIATATRNRSFPRASCGDPFQSSGIYWPVFIDGGNISRIRANFCNDAFTTVRSDTGVRSVQLASFTSYERALSFAKQVGGTVGQATSYVNGRVVN